MAQQPPFAACFWWRDSSPGDVPLDHTWLRATDPSGSTLTVAGDPGALLDDRGLSFQTRVRRREGDAYVWSTLFVPGPDELAALRAAGSVQLRAGDVASPAFDPQALPACSDDAARACTGAGEWSHLPAARGAR